MLNSVLDNGEILAHRPSGRNKLSPQNEMVPSGKGETNTKRLTEITVEKHRVLTISTRRILALDWCAVCGMNVQMLTADDAARFARVTPRTIYQRAEAGQLHFKESQDGLLLICIRSLG
jgi:hypothetical protein